MTANELADELEKHDVYVEKMETDFGGYQYPDFVCITPMANEIASKLRQQAKEIEQLKEKLEDCTCQGGHSEAYLKAKGKL